ncbi:MAG: hypothetical protein MJB57_08755, partial [Gemmatimonadetes bacterium]|nr:hypothetical protein [Gemmatimonadota bacterium]
VTSAPIERPFGPGTLLTFDCYGTLIDWETGILGGLRGGFPDLTNVADGDLLGAFHDVQNELKTSEYRPYRDLLSEVAAAVAARYEAEGHAEPRRAARVPESVPSWTPFGDTDRGLRRLDEAGVTLGILSNIDNDLLAGTLEHFDVTFSLLGTAQNLRSYKPAAPHFERGREWAGEYDGWIHVAQSLFHDVAPATALGIPVVWVNRKDEPLPEATRPVHVAPDLASAADWLLAS